LEFSTTISDDAITSSPFIFRDLEQPGTAPFQAEILQLQVQLDEILV
jgi:hypothetical protein